MFFINLQGYPDPLAWIGGLPDVLAKKAVRDSAELRASFGNVERKDFVLRSDQCGNVLANARCFAVVSPLEFYFKIFLTPFSHTALLCLQQIALLGFFEPPYAAA